MKHLVHQYNNNVNHFCFKKQIQEAEYGSDLAGVQSELKLYQNEHKIIEQFHSRVEQCINAKVCQRNLVIVCNGNEN